MTDKSAGTASILLLASDPLMRKILCDTLESAGYLVVTAADVGAAVDRLKEMRPDLLIVRPYISSMPGHMAANYLRSRWPGLPVLIIGGFMDDDRIRTQISVEDFHVFPKPYPAAELLGTVKEVMRSIQEKHR
jgi:DNA-binding NtrC family response regulator